MIKGSQWRINYPSKPPNPKYGALVITVYKPAGSDIPEKGPLSLDGTVSDSSYFYKSGTFSIRLTPPTPTGQFQLRILLVKSDRKS